MVIKDFLQMGGYAFYVWSAYALVFIFLFIQWRIPQRQLNHYLKNKTNTHE